MVDYRGGGYASYQHSSISTLLRKASKEERRKRKERGKNCHKTCQGRTISCLSSHNYYWLIPFISGEGEVQVGKF